MKGILVSVFSVLLLCASSARGAVPAEELISYSQTSGALTPGSTYTIRFSLWDSGTVGTGTMVWSEEKSITVAGNNTITTKLGSVSTLSSVDFSSQYWVQADKKTATGTYRMIGTARKPFTMVPYAEYALAGATVNVAGGDVTGILPIANGGTGSGTQNFIDLTGDQTISGAKTFLNTIVGNISGNAATASSVINGVYTTGSYADPAWMTSLSGGKISGDISGNAASITGSISESQVTDLTVDLGNKAASGANGDIRSLNGLNSRAAIMVNPYGTSAGNTGEIRFQELTANGSKYVGLKAPDSINASLIWTLPAGDGTAGQVIQTDGSGNLGWVANNGGTVTSVSTGGGLTGGPITGSGTISIASGGVTNSMLANSSLTVTAGTGLSGGGTVSLGGAVSLSNAGVLSIGANAPLSVTGSQNPVISLDSANLVDLGSDQTIAGTKTFSNTIIGSISGNAATAATALKVAFYGKVAIVATIGGDYGDPAAAMSDYASWCGTPSAVNPCLLKIMPGIYTVTSPVVMQPYVDIEGSGENTTTITGAITSISSPPTTGTVRGASNAELRFLTVANTGGSFSTAIFNSSASPSIFKVTANGHIGIDNESSSPTMTNVTAASNYYGGIVNNNYSSPAMTNIGVNGFPYGIYNSNYSSPNMMNITATSSNGYGVYNTNYSSPTMTNINVNGGVGVYNSYSSPTMTNITAIATNGGIFNSNSSPIMANIVANGASYGIDNESSSPTMTNIIASGGNYGIYNNISGAAVTTVKINHSVITGGLYSIFNGSSVTTLVGNTQLNGGPVSNAGTLTCVGVYSANYAALGTNCQ